MNTSDFLRSLFLALCLSLIPASGFTQAQPAQDYKPEVGQEGKDVVWVPTPQALVDKMLDMAKVTPKDYVIDLGSGDGRTVITAAKRGSKALGIEYNPDMVELSKRNAAKEGVSDKATFIKADLFESDFSQAQVITMFSAIEHQSEAAPEDPRSEARHADRFEHFRHGRVETRRDARFRAANSWCTAHLWIVPAKVDGHMEAAARRAYAQADFSNDFRHAQERQRHYADFRQA